ncbi:ASPH [Symbiodinium natans]|uniref:ASPH protein n=1 Tax=Symbiodinium natans TaxID=878477 RepID=A0A812Q8X6_9DINO|nr:ASPH [Symbiodinium natans]
MVQLLSLSGEKLPVDLEDAATVKDVRARAAEAMGCEPSSILLVASGGTDCLQDPQQLESVKCTSLTVINQSFDPLLLRRLALKARAMRVSTPQRNSPFEMSTLVAFLRRAATVGVLQEVAIESFAAVSSLSWMYGFDKIDAASSRRENYAKALDKAKEAVALSPVDPLNWETLGNAYVGNFFVNAKRPDEIKRALIAYEKGEAAYEKLGKRNPTLHFNRGMAAKYVEDYDLASRSLAVAIEIGAAGAAEERQKVLALVDSLAEHLNKKCDKKKLKDLSPTFPDNSAYSKIKDLQVGKPSAGSLAARVVTLLNRPGEVPIITICCDMSGELFAMSFYNTEFQKLQQAIVPGKTVLAVENPSLRQIEVTLRGPLSYSCVAVGNPAEVWIIGASAGVASASLACAAGGSVVYSVAADRSMEEAKSGSKEACGQNMEECQEILARIVKADGGRTARTAVLRAIVPQIRFLVGKELGTDAGSRLQRVEAMLQRIGRGEVFRSEEKEGQRRASGYIAGLEPCSAFHDPLTLAWTSELQGHWKEIQSELRSRLGDETVWLPGVYAAQNKRYAPEWKVAAVLAADGWEDKGSFPKTQAILKRLEGLLPFEVFFAHMPPRTKISSHSDNLNYILTLHLALQLESSACSLQVGRRTQQWEEGEVLVFDTTFTHSASNDSDRDRYVLVVRFWHPGLSSEERKALQLSHLLLSRVLAADATSEQAELPWT